nr:hypothetical protein [Halorubrum sp. ARQ200]
MASLLDNCRAGHEFSDLRLVVDPDWEIVPHQTVYAGEEFPCGSTSTLKTSRRPGWGVVHGGRGYRCGTA